MVSTNKKECESAGVDEQELKKVMRAIEKQFIKLDRMGLYLFGSGEATVRKYDEKKGSLVVGHIGGCIVDGGAGDANTKLDGLVRGETA